MLLQLPFASCSSAYPLSLHTHTRQEPTAYISPRLSSQHLPQPSNSQTPSPQQLAQPDYRYDSHHVHRHPHTAHRVLAQLIVAVAVVKRLVAPLVAAITPFIRAVYVTEPSLPARKVASAASVPTLVGAGQVSLQRIQRRAQIGVRPRGQWRRGRTRLHSVVPAVIRQPVTTYD